MSDELPAIIIEVRGGTVVGVYGTTPIEVFVVDYDNYPRAPQVEENIRELDGGFDPLYVNEVQDKPSALDRHLEKSDVPQA